MHASSRSALDRFVTLLEGPEGNPEAGCKAGNYVELKKTFPAVDQAGAATIFDVGGNKVRVISVVNYTGQQVLVTQLLTHEEYDKGNW